MDFSRWRFISDWSSGIVVVSTLMPATRVFVGLSKYPAPAAVPETPSRRAISVVRTMERRTELRLAEPPRDRVDSAR